MYKFYIVFALLFSYSERPSAHKIPSILRTQIYAKICYFNQFPIQAQQTCHSREVSGGRGMHIPIFPRQIFRNKWEN